MKVIPETYGAH